MKNINKVLLSIIVLSTTPILCSNIGEERVSPTARMFGLSKDMDLNSRATFEKIQNKAAQDILRSLIFLSIYKNNLTIDQLNELLESLRKIDTLEDETKRLFNVFLYQLNAIDLSEEKVSIVRSCLKLF